ncbi:MAG: hypothetical protein CMH55_02660 [Myxococcales bacterium]|nr:hypothetical protein [Myxococcales bacterium]
MRSLLCLLLAGCGPATASLTVGLPLQVTSGADRIQLSVFESQTCEGLSLPLDGSIEASSQQEFSRGALSDTTGQSAILSLENVPAETELTLTAEVFGQGGSLQFQGCEEGLMVASEERKPVVLRLH